MSARQQDGTPPAGGFLHRLRVAVPVLGAAVALVVLVAWIPGQQAEVVATARPPVNVDVLTVVRERDFPDSFELTGIVAPNAVVRVSSEIPARVERWAPRSTEPHAPPLIEGDFVIAGQPLVYLNDELLRARLARTQAQFEFDDREFRRLQDLYERRSTSPTELDDARTRRDIAAADLAEAERALDRATLYAPRSGVLNKLPLEPGEYANIGDFVAEIVEIDPVRILVDVPEREVGWFSTGGPATLLGLPSDVIPTARIVYIDALATPETRTTRMELLLPNPTGRLRSGQIVRVQLTRRVLDEVVMIPLASVIPFHDARIVFVVEDGVAIRRTVELGFIKGTRVQILAGLNGGEALIVRGHRYVGPDQPVQITATHPAPTERGEPATEWVGSAAP
ncbi:MAG: efflux RND transporter periplasmic adaptor subunit [Phycisphaerales bacterium]|nr:efflux RND transporter periplasmic adaptor subunit [Phycisphaerales bacterium]